MKDKYELKAVALKYPKSADAPFLCAKGKGEVAKKIIEIAHKNKIPVVEDKVLSQVLTLEEIGSAVPEQTWEVLAKIFACIIETEQKL